MHHTFKKKVALLSISDPGPPRGGAGGPVVPAAASGDLRGGVQRRTDGQPSEREAFKREESKIGKG